MGWNQMMRTGAGPSIPPLVHTHTHTHTHTHEIRSWGMGEDRLGVA